ncbi:hypothetical protein [Emticicia sp. BO119]|nr:hypothetical protein [Emticicia sp. BO119]
MNETEENIPETNHKPDDHPIVIKSISENIIVENKHSSIFAST